MSFLPLSLSVISLFVHWILVRESKEKHFFPSPSSSLARFLQAVASGGSIIGRRNAKSHPRSLALVARSRHEQRDPSRCVWPILTCARTSRRRHRERTFSARGQLGRSFQQAERRQRSQGPRCSRPGGAREAPPESSARVSASSSAFAREDGAALRPPQPVGVEDGRRGQDRQEESVGAGVGGPRREAERTTPPGVGVEGPPDDDPGTSLRPCNGG